MEPGTLFAAATAAAFGLPTFGVGLAVWITGRSPFAPTLCVGGAMLILAGIAIPTNQYAEVRDDLEFERALSEHEALMRRLGVK